MVREAEALLDVREATGHNDGPQVAWILSHVELAEGFSWCGAFVYTAMAEAGVTLPAPARAYAWAPTWTAKHVIWRASEKRRTGEGQTYGDTTQDEPGPGDVFGLWFPSKQRVAHVGLITDWQPGNKYTLTIEGNTNTAGSREGDGVYSKRRLKAQLYRVSRWAC